MDQIEEKIEPMYSAEIKKEHVLEALQKLKAEGYSQRIDVDPHAGGRTFDLGEAIEDRVVALGAKQPATIERSADLHALHRAEAVDQRSGAFAANGNLSSVRRQPQGSATIALGDGN